MKQLIKILNISVCLIAFFQVNGQETEEYIKLLTHYANDEVRLRWIVPDRGLWEWGNQYGYKIERITLEDNGVKLSFSERQASKIILVNNYLPKSEAEFEDPANLDNDYIQSGKNLLYNDSLKAMPVAAEAATLAAAVDADNKREGRHLMTMITAEMDFDAACALGMAYLDNSIEENKLYYYILSFAKQPEQFITEYSFDDFNLSMGNWNDGGANCYTYVEPYVKSGSYALVLRDDHSSSYTKTENLDLSGVSSIDFEFSVRPLRVDSGEGFNVELSTDGGSSFELLEEYIVGDQMSYNTRYDGKLTIDATLSDQTQIRVRSTANALSEFLYFDDFKLSINQAGSQELFDFNDFEEGLGVWQDGGARCYLNYRGFVSSPPKGMVLRNSGPSASLYSTAMDLSALNSVDVSFMTFVWGLDAGENFQILYSSDGGATFEVKGEWTIGDNIVNNRQYFNQVTINNPSAESVVKFQVNSDHNADRIVIDDVKISAVDKVVKAFELVETNAVDVLPTVDLQAGYGGENQVILEWDLTGNASDYTSFDIERSVDGVSFEKVNDYPFIYVTDDEELPETAYYQDSIPDNSTTYIYRVCGKSSFGITSGPSDTVHVKGIPPRLTVPRLIEGDTETSWVNAPLQMKIDTFDYDAGNDNVIINWETLIQETEAKITGYNVLKSLKSIGPYMKLNNELLYNTTYSYTDINPANASYYIVECQDVGGNKYQSLPYFVQLPDSMPPAIPVVHSAVFVTDYDIKIDWNKVTDTDLYGYNVYYANQRDGSFMKVNATPWAGTSYSFTINQETAADSIFIKMSSEDFRQNQSQLSLPIGVSRPDLHPPSSPVLALLAPKPNGIEISWVFSSSDDVTKHVLQRKMNFGSHWVDLVTIEKDEEDQYPSGASVVSYIDSSYAEIMAYDYRFLAYDESFNGSSSALVTTTPTKLLVKGNIENVNVGVESEATFTSPDIQEQLNNLQDLGWKTDQFKNVSNNYSMTLTWDYILDPGLEGFTIYRAMTGGRMSEYKTISLGKAMGLPESTITVNQSMGKQKFTFVDEDLIKNRRYTYEIKANHKDGSVSHRSSQVSKVLPKS